MAHVQAVLALGKPVTFLSAPGSALFAGSMWWRALIERGRSEHPHIRIEDILDCADASGLALGAFRIGQTRIVLSRSAPGWEAVAAIAASLGGEVLTTRPPSLDMAERNAARRLHDWLQLRTAPGDSNASLG